MGQGDTAFLEYKSGTKTCLVLIDGFTGSSNAQAPNYRNLALEYYINNFNGIPIDLIIITHWHADHFNAIGNIIDHISTTQQKYVVYLFCTLSFYVVFFFIFIHIFYHYILSNGLTK